MEKINDSYNKYQDSYKRASKKYYGENSDTVKKRSLYKYYIRKGFSHEIANEYVSLRQTVFDIMKNVSEPEPDNFCEMKKRLVELKNIIKLGPTINNETKKTLNDDIKTI